MYIHRLKGNIRILHEKFNFQNFLQKLFLKKKYFFRPKFFDENILAIAIGRRRFQ